jgi:hypothetical protein
MKVPALFLGGLLLAWAACDPGHSEILTAEKRLQAAEKSLSQAKVRRDIKGLRDLLDDQYLGLNHSGKWKTKRELVDVFAKGFALNEIAVSGLQVRVAGDVATVTGRVKEKSCTDDSLLFMRTYVRREGEWRLFNSVQFREPEIPGQEDPSTPPT